MKKHVKRNRNKKGSVLLTVVCFTLVCMIIASTALSLANYSARTSNHNVRSTQAEISAQNYLQEYINSFTGTDPDTRFEDLATLAGPSASNPNEYTAELKDNANNTVNSVSSTAKIKIYKADGGIVVRAEVDSNGETEVASAFFDGQTVNPYISSNVLETYDGATNTKNALYAEGDMLIEGSQTDLIEFHNSQSDTEGNFLTNQNVIAGHQTDANIRDTVDGKAPIMAAQGYIFWYQATMATSKTKNFTNKMPMDGYILTEQAFVDIPVAKPDPVIGSSGNPIDIYCNGAYFGGVPKYLPYTNSSSKYINPDYDPMIDIWENNSSGSSRPYGNFPAKDMNNCYTPSEIYGSLYSEGNVFIAPGSGKTVKINGDLYVNGDLCICNNACLAVTGTIYCTGNIYAVDTDDKITATGIITPTFSGISTITASDYSIGSPSGDGSERPTMNNGATKITEIYQTKTPNDMFVDTSTAGNDGYYNIAGKYKKAYNNVGVKEGAAIETNLNWYDGIYVNEDCTKSLKEAADDVGEDINEYFRKNYSQNGAADSTTILYINAGYNTSTTYLKYGYRLVYNNSGTDGFKIYSTDEWGNFKFEIKMSRNDDFIMILPFDSTHLNIRVNYSNSALLSANPTDPKRGPYNTVDTPVNFCYFMLDSGANGDYYTGAADPSSETWDFETTTIVDVSRYSYGLSEINNKKYSCAEKVSANNNIILIPDNANVKVKNQTNSNVNVYEKDPALAPGEFENYTCIQAVFYGPKANLTIVGTGNSPRVLLGQAIVGSVDIGNNASNIATLLPSPGSVMDMINSTTSGGSIYKLQYYTKSKT